VAQVSTTNDAVTLTAMEVVYASNSTCLLWRPLHLQVAQLLSYMSWLPCTWYKADSKQVYPLPGMAITVEKV
jgi:hypothetical protein